MFLIRAVGGDHGPPDDEAAPILCSSSAHLSLEQQLRFNRPVRVMSRSISAMSAASSWAAWAFCAGSVPYLCRSAASLTFRSSACSWASKPDSSSDNLT